MRNKSTLHPHATDRRTVLSMFAGGCACCSMPALGQSRIVSCGISAADMRLLANSGSLVGVNDIAIDRGVALPGLDSSGDRRFDQSLGETLSHIASTLGAFPYFSFYDDRQVHEDLKGGAFASRLALKGGEGTVVYSLSLVERARRQQGADDAMIAICAHEFGHVLGFKLGLDEALHRFSLPQSAFELHADYLAGYYVQRYLALRQGGISGIAGVWSGLGGLRNGSHGSARHRRDSFTHGYRFGSVTPNARGDHAFHAGVKFLKGYHYG